MRYGLLVAALALAGCCGNLGKKGEEKGGSKSTTPGAQVANDPAPAPVKEPAITVPLKQILADYKGNEVRADNAYKDKRIRFTGKVHEVKKGVIGDQIYLIVNTTGGFEFPSAQCYVDDAAKAAELNKGASVTLECDCHGKLGNVSMKDCFILP